MALDDKHDIDFDSLSPEEQAEWLKADKKFKARMRGMTIFCLLLAVPICIGAWLVIRVKLRIRSDRAWAVAELAKPQPAEMAYGVLGSIDLNDGQVADSLPLLKMAAQLEARRGETVQAHLMYVEALIEGEKSKLPGASRAEELAVLKSAEAMAAKLPRSRAAAAYHGAGKLYAYLGLKTEALALLKKAVELQPDDWVDEGGAKPYKHRGISSTYEKDYAAAELN